MVSFSKVEDRPTPKEVYNWRVYSCAIVAATAAVMIGYDSAFIGTTISTTAFKREFGLLLPSAGGHTTAAQFATLSANIVSTYQGGCFFGALLGYPAGVLLGRRWGLLLSALVFCIGCGIMLISIATRSLGPIYAGRIIAGLGIGAASNLTPLYISEIAPPAIRGQLVGMYECGWQIGGLVGFWINYGISKHIPVSNKQWIIPFAVQLLPGGLFAIGIPFAVRESPRWLFSVGRRDEAMQNLTWIRGLPSDHPYIIEEVNMIDIQLQHDISAVGEGFWAPFRSLFSRGDLVKRLLIVTTLFAFQNGTGINAINYYSPTIFKSLGIQGSQTGLLTTGIFGVIKTIGGFTWTFLIIDQFGRRGILLVGAVGGAVSMAVIAGYNHIADPANHPSASGNLPAGGIAAMVFFYVWTAFYAVSWNGTPWVVCSESFPGGVRMLTTMFAAAANWLDNFAIARSTPTMFLKMGHSGWGVYLFFTCCQILSIPYIIFLLPETKHIPLEEMDRLWQLTPWTANKKVMAELQREHAVGGNNTSYVIQDKTHGSEERFEESSDKA